MENRNTRLSAQAVAFLFISALFGAAFASGQEILKFFGSYGPMGKWGILLATFFFLVLSNITLKLSFYKKTDRLEDIISPVDHPIIKGFVSLVIKFCLIVIYIALMAAASVLFYEQFGIPRWIGGLAVGTLVVITTIIGFDGIKKIIPIVTPVMLISVICVCIAVLLVGESGPGDDFVLYQSPLAPNWVAGSLIYVSYNFIAAVPFLNTVACQTGLSREAKTGTALGAVGLGAAAFLLYAALSHDLNAAGGFELPMLYLAGKLAPVLGVLYSGILLIAIYSASVNALFGATKNVGREKPARRAAIIAVAGLVGYLVSMMGFSNIVSYIYPIQGYLCIALLICIVISYGKWCLFDGKRRKAGTSGKG